MQTRTQSKLVRELTERHRDNVYLTFKDDERGFTLGRPRSSDLVKVVMSLSPATRQALAGPDSKVNLYLLRAIASAFRAGFTAAHRLVRR